MAEFDPQKTGKSNGKKGGDKPDTNAKTGEADKGPKIIDNNIEDRVLQVKRMLEAGEVDTLGSRDENPVEDGSTKLVRRKLHEEEIKQEILHLRERNMDKIRVEEQRQRAKEEKLIRKQVELMAEALPQSRFINKDCMLKCIVKLLSVGGGASGLAYYFGAGAAFGAAAGPIVIIGAAATAAYFCSHCIG